MFYNRRGENLSAIPPEKMKLNRSISEEAKTNYHLIVEEYDEETITHDKAAKITESVKGSDLMEPNIVLLAQTLMKNGSLNTGRKSYERETCIFHELENTFKIVKLGEVLWWRNEISGVTNPPKTLFETKTVLSKQEWIKLHSSSNMKTLKEVGNHKISDHKGRNKKIYVNFARKYKLYFLMEKTLKNMLRYCQQKSNTHRI